MRKSIYLLFLFLLFCIACKKSTAPQQQEVNIGAFLSLTGNWSSLGIASQEAIQLAVSDVNTYMEQLGSIYRFTATIYDTKLDTGIVKTAVANAVGKGIRFMVGPQSSAEVAAIRDFTEANRILIVSQGSTASSLAIPGDGIFRFCPGDVVEGTAMAKSIYASGRRALVTISRDDAGNKGLQKAVGAEFNALGGFVQATKPYVGATRDFSSLLYTVKTSLNQYISTYGADQVGVYLASFDDCAELFKQAKTDPVFSSVHWFGGDGVVLSSTLVADTAASAFASAVQFFAPNFGLPSLQHPDLEAIATYVKSKTGADPDAYALASYDAVWVIAKTFLSAPASKSDFTLAKDLFQKEADHYFGITGPMLLNDAGDRSTGSFDYFGVVQEGGTYSWKLVGKSY